MTIDIGALGRLGEVQVKLSVELGRAELPLKEVLSLQEGSVVALERLVDELLDVTANGAPIARAEVVAQEGRFALRVVELVGDESDTPGSSWPAPGQIDAASAQANGPDMSGFMVDSAAVQAGQSEGAPADGAADAPANGTANGTANGPANGTANSGSKAASGKGEQNPGSPPSAPPPADESDT